MVSLSKIWAVLSKIFRADIRYCKTLLTYSSVGID